MAIDIIVTGTADKPSNICFKGLAYTKISMHKKIAIRTIILLNNVLPLVAPSLEPEFTPCFTLYNIRNALIIRMAAININPIYFVVISTLSAK